MKIKTFYNLLLIYSTILGVLMLYFAFQIQNIAIRITLIFLIAMYIIGTNWNVDNRDGKK